MSSRSSPCSYSRQNLFFMTKYHPIVCVWVCPFIHQGTLRLLMCLQFNSVMSKSLHPHGLQHTRLPSLFITNCVLVIVNNAAVNMEVQMSFWDSDVIFFWLTPRSGIAGTYDISVVNFLRSLHGVFHSVCISLHSHQQWMNGLLGLIRPLEFWKVIIGRMEKISL